jgi:hypothetical protein
MKSSNSLLCILLTSLCASLLSMFLLLNFIPAGRTMYSEKQWVSSKTESMNDVSELKEFIGEMASGAAHVQENAETCLKWTLCLNTISAGFLVWSVIIIRARAKSLKEGSACAR